MQNLFKKIETNKNLKSFIPEIMKAKYSLSTIRYIVILTMINDDIYDESIIRAYENKHINQEESKYLNSQFLTEVKGKSYTLKRKK